MLELDAVDVLGKAIEYGFAFVDELFDFVEEVESFEHFQRLFQILQSLQWGDLYLIKKGSQHPRTANITNNLPLNNAPKHNPGKCLPQLIIPQSSNLSHSNKQPGEMLNILHNNLKRPTNITNLNNSKIMTNFLIIQILNIFEYLFHSDKI